MKKVVKIFSKYSTKGASSRLRSIQYIPFIQKEGFTVENFCLISNEQISNKYKYGKYKKLEIIWSYINRCKQLIMSNREEIIIIEKEVFPYLPYFFEKIFLIKKKYILDYDDAIFHNYDSHSSKVIQLLFGKKISKLIQKSSLVFCGNTYLYDYSMQNNKNSFIIPTVIDVDRYLMKSSENLNKKIKIVWIGSPSTIKYLSQIKNVFINLSSIHEFTLKVIGVENFYIDSVEVENVQWSEATEVNEISECDIGIMPLANTKWEQGKCGYKLIQYMACALPVVASGIGANNEIVINNKSGFLVDHEEDWIQKLSELICSYELRNSFGIQGRKIVEEKYCIQKSNIKYIKHLESI